MLHDEHARSPTNNWEQLLHSALEVRTVVSLIEKSTAQEMKEAALH